MSVEVVDDCEYTVLISDLIITLDKLVKDGVDFKINFWITNNELPISFLGRNCDFLFIQEGVKITDNGYVYYIFYDTIEHIVVME